jgi:hypothetical protein
LPPRSKSRIESLFMNPNSRAPYESANEKPDG